MNDISYKQFGRLMPIEYAGHGYWKCRCTCGNVKIIRGADILNGKTQSCGCLQRERTSNANAKHRLHDSRLYNIWCGMKQRCFYKNHVRYHRYGARGITVCDEWKNDFQAFYDWSMSHGYADDLTIDRINNDGNYEPSNCRWATPKEQYKNQSNHFGKVM